MANEIMLEVYTFQVRNKGEKDIYQKLSSYFGRRDFLDFVESYFTNHIKELVINNELAKSIQIAPNSFRVNKSKRMISGIMDAGDFGTTSKIIDDKGKVKYRKRKQDSDMRPFYYLVFVPQRLNIGYLVLQRIGAHGINTVFCNNLQDRFSKEFPDMLIEYNQYVAKSLARKIAEEGEIKDIVLRRHNLPKDITDKFGLEKLGVDVKNVKISITTSGIINMSKSFLNGGNANFFDIPEELKTIGFDGSHSTSFRVMINGNSRTINMSDTGRVRPYFNVDDDVVKLESGHPQFDSIDKVAKKLLLDLTKDLGDEI